MAQSRAIQSTGGIKHQVTSKEHQLSNWQAVTPAEGLRAKETQAAKCPLGCLGPSPLVVQPRPELRAELSRGRSLPHLRALSSHCEARRKDNSPSWGDAPPPSSVGEGMKLERLQGHAVSPRQTAQLAFSSPSTLCELFSNPLPFSASEDLPGF